MALYSSYNQIGISEDVSAIIKNITPFDTPFLSMIKNEKVHNRTFEYQEDTLRNPNVNAKLEGADSSSVTLSPTTMRSGTCQIIEEMFQISATADAVKTHGRAQETALRLVA